MLIANGLTGYLASVYNLTAPPAEWKPCGIPLTKLMDMELRSGKKQPVIKKTVIDLNGKPFKTFAAQREQWAVETAYIFPALFSISGRLNYATFSLKHYFWSMKSGYIHDEPAIYEQSGICGALRKSQRFLPMAGRVYQL